jgi:putative ABC transport system substrate-binding protein
VRLRALVGAAGLFLVIAAAASAARPRIVVVGPAEEPRFSEVVRGLSEGLAEQGRSLATFDVVETRVPRAEPAAAHAAVQAALRPRPDVMFVIGSALARIARDAGPDVPVVFITPGDPVAAGMAASFRQPGGNASALMFEYPELSGKRLELLKELVPSARRVLVLYDPRDQSPAQGFAAARDAASKLGLTVVAGELGAAAEAAAVVERTPSVDGVLLIPGGAAFAAAADVIRAATSRRLPMVAASRREATLGALATYGASDVDAARDAARLVDKILRGARAGDLPIERPTRLRLVLNQKTARTLGLALPNALVLRADETIN